ncbi:hypothetical protein GCM10028773_23180 [Spirosoma koreense]
MFFNGWSYWVNLDEVTNVHKSLNSDLHNWRENQLLITMPAGQRTYDKFYSQILGEAIKEGVYRLPEPQFESALVSTQEYTDNPLKLIEKDSTFKQGERKHEQLTLTRNPTQNWKQAYLLLRSRQHTFVWPVDQSRYKLAYFLQNGDPVPPGEVATIFLDMLPKASYQVGILYEVDSHWEAAYSREVIPVKQR